MPANPARVLRRCVATRRIGASLLTRLPAVPAMTARMRSNIYSVNEANRQQWDLPMQEYISALQKGEGQSGTRYTSRYIGSMVGDVHRTLIYGGLCKSRPSAPPKPPCCVDRTACLLA
eukprot:5025194-Pleurochrysis_carterae.AAC.1